MDHRDGPDRPALHGEPRRDRPRGAAPQPGVRPRGPLAGRGRALHGAERRRARYRERGHVQRGQPAAELWNKLRSLCAYLCAQYGIRPSQIYGHRDFKDTACPGDRLYAALPRLRSEVAGLLGQRLTKATVSEAAWPLLRIADRGERVLAAQHLLRAAGVPGVVPDGRFTRELADTVRAFQDEHGFGRDDPGRDEADGPTGMIGGETWPALARPVRAGEGGEAAAGRRGPPARPGPRLPDVVTPEIWQHLLTR